MSNKRKNDSTPSPSSSTPLSLWDETKACLESIDDSFDWVHQLQTTVQQHSMDNNNQSKVLEQQASEMKKSLESQIADERQAFVSESDHLYTIIQSIHELQSLVTEEEEAISELRESQVTLRSKIHSHKHEVSQKLEEMDHVEIDRMQQVPKIKNQISLYAKTTGIKWDYHRDSVLAGQVVCSALSVLCIMLYHVVCCF